jgi:hypothetical protein
MSFTIEKLRQDLDVLAAKKEHALHSFHQIVGAISIVDQMIERLLNETLQESQEVIEGEQ